MSCRERLSTVRNRTYSKSNRSSLYIPSTYSSTYSSSSSSTYSSRRTSTYDLTSSRTSLVFPQSFSILPSKVNVDEVESKLDELLKRTENFGSRVNKIRKSQCDISNQITRMYDNSNAYVSTELEWKRLLDSQMLIDKAVELIQKTIRRPKGKFEYSPEPTPRPVRAFEFRSDTVLVSPPWSSDDEEDGNYSV